MNKLETTISVAQTIVRMRTDKPTTVQIAKAVKEATVLLDTKADGELAYHRLCECYGL